MGHRSGRAGGLPQHAMSKRNPDERSVPAISGSCCGGHGACAPLPARLRSPNFRTIGARRTCEMLL